MTFYEAALRVLEEAGAPLHAGEITKRSLDKGLLSHTGKLPDVTMLSRLAAMAKRSRDRRIMVTAKDTFALTDWMLNEDAEALASTGVPEVNPEAALPPLRASERHPEPRAEYLRSIGRQAERKRRGDDEKRKKHPPVAEVVFEVLSESTTALPPNELLARLRTREMIADDLGVGALLEGLAVDNQRRVDEGRRPQFAAVRAEGGELQLSIETSNGEGAASPLELQAAFCTAARLPFENGRVVTRASRRDSASASSEAVVLAASPEDAALVDTAKSAVRDAKRAMARLLRQTLNELEVGTFEKACAKLLHAMHFRELKVVRRGRDGLLYTTRKRDGNLELRYAVRVVKTPAIERRHIQELRRDVTQHGANVGLLLSTGDVRGDARSEATHGALTLVWSGDALAEKFCEAHVGVSVTQVELYAVDADFFTKAKVDAEEAAKRREERQRDRPPAPAATAPSPEATPPMTAAESAAPAEASSGSSADTSTDSDDDGDEGDDEAVSADGTPAQTPGAPGEGRKRRRRRRRRRGGGAGGPGGGGPR
ncbi:MAG: restriction endonuclease, partial [Archangium sp.]|nr:restriction endonuclease [Archangium sp.]